MFVSILLACFGELAVILCASIFARVWVTVLGLLWGNSRFPMGQWFTVAIKCARLYVLVVLQCVVSSGRLAECCSVLVFFFPPTSTLAIIIVLISPLSPLFSVTSAWAGAGCGRQG